MYDDLDEPGLITLSAQFESQKLFEDALLPDRELLRRQPENQDYKVRLAEHLYHASSPLTDMDKAIGYLDEAIGLCPDRGNFYNNRGTCWNEKMEYSKAVSDYKQAIGIKDDDPDFYENIGDCYYLGEKNTELAIDAYTKCIELHEKVTPIVEKDLVLLYHYRAECRYEAKDFNDAVADYTREIELSAKVFPGSPKDYANTYNDRGLSWYAQFRYEEAIADYKVALEADEELFFCHHNLYLSYVKMGLYDVAYDHLQQAIEMYEQQLAIEPDAGTADERLPYYKFLAELYLYSYIDSELAEVEPLLESGLKLSPGDWDLNLTAAKYYNAKKYLVCQKNASKDKLSALEDRVLGLQNDCLRSANRYYKTACGIFAGDELGRKDRDKMAEMASLHLLFENKGEAEKLYDAALTAYEGHVPSLVGKGVLLAGRGSYEESIAQFEKAYLSDSDDLNIQTNTAEAHFRSGHYTESERIYKRILAVAGHNQDAIVGLGELFKTMGDQARDKNNKADAEDYYKWAEDWYNKSLDWQVSFDAKKVIPSRRLSVNDQASIQYSVAYIHCCLYELTATATYQDRSLLKTARSSFKRICKGTDDYYKAQASIRKIDKALSPNGILTTKTGAGLVIGLAMVLLFGIQYVFFFPGTQTRTTWSVSSARLRQWADSVREGLLYPEISKLTDTPFNSLPALERAYHLALGLHDSINIPDIGPIAIATVQSSRAERQVGEASYIAVSFGCLLFIIAGFFMGQISKLKVAGLELEKNVIDQINTNLQSLGIAPGD